ncbi:(2Fe-2S)-binding protein [Streptomyces sp. NBC_00847]|uniref:(2Fe-2S)-binding protein n=1 Tax=Streptomyces sp. NBC_00847 TaxID=2975850 RepID=UPI00225DE366|nr:(2Fe-2S)-binding protein [Streptomyces sp. NBC_00847]MCX4885442.1 (2Fe-2S)-binding protein [Streptomyces sp. NBC_00847]
MVLLLLVDLDQDLAALGPLGGFFVLRTGGAPHAPLPTLADAYTTYTCTTHTTYPQENQSSDARGNPITFRVEKVAHSLRAPEMRIAVSVAQQGLAARLWSVTLACAVLYGSVPDLDPGLLHWDPDAGAPGDLWLAEVRPLPADAATVADVVLKGHLEPLAAALRARHRVAPGLLRGNAASALAGAARQLDHWAAAHGHPRAAAHTRSLAAGLLAHPLLSGTGTLTGTSFRRRSCCLYYRVPGGGLCGDCCFTRPPRSSAHGTSG